MRAYVFQETNRRGSPKRILGIVQSDTYPNDAVRVIEADRPISRASEVQDASGATITVYKTAHDDGSPFFWTVTAYEFGMFVE